MRTILTLFSVLALLGVGQAHEVGEAMAAAATDFLNSLEEEQKDKATFELTDEEFEWLYVACRDHTDGNTDANITIQTCWDSDRLDLGRVGVTPDPEFLNTESAKHPDTIAWAHARAVDEIVPEVIADIWFGRGGTV